MNITIIIFSGISMLWDIVTSAVGLLSVFSLFDIGDQKSILQLVVNIVLGNTVAAVFAFVLTGAIICTDIWFSENFLDPQAKDKRFVKKYPNPYAKQREMKESSASLKESASGTLFVYGGFLGWAIVKIYDFYSTLIGTSVCLIPDMASTYNSMSFLEVIRAADLTQQMFLFLLSFLVAASPLVFISKLKEMNPNDSKDRWQKAYTSEVKE